ncbi:MAG TPA: hypothetical protein VFZ71_08435 [Pyrinomonadaceae bacterium]
MSSKIPCSVLDSDVSRIEIDELLALVGFVGHGLKITSASNRIQLVRL